jgi:phage replication O-like protein O
MNTRHAPGPGRRLDAAPAEQDLEKEEPPEGLHTEKVTTDSLLAGAQVGKGRVPYALAGEAMRQAYARANRVALTARDHRVLGACLALTVGYSKLTDRVYRAEIEKLANLPGRHTSTALNKLNRLGIVAWQPSRGRGRPSTLALPDPRKRGPQAAPLLGGKEDRNGGQEATADDYKRGPQNGNLPRRTEKNLGERTAASEEETGDVRVSGEGRAFGLNPNGVCSHGSCHVHERCLYD